MPIYEYGCPDCGHHFDVIQKFSDDPVTLCPSCAQNNVKKRITASSFVLKGGGWYKDHYGLKSSGAGTSGDGAASSGGSASTAASSTPPATTSSSGSGGGTGSGTP
ncbi:MAG: hypothetical protein RLZZ299_3098 [Pseudomonadota bacterium]|jgi:putative FmdB family regulatory protein